MARTRSLVDAVAAARSSVEACVVVGGHLFANADVMGALSFAARRGVAVRLLFPSARSRWLRELVNDRMDVDWYHRRVVVAASAAGDTIPGAHIRWYESPGPCWFVMMDRSVLFTKSFEVARETIPVIQTREEHVEHFNILFDQLWDCSLEDYRTPSIPIASTPLVTITSITPEVISRLAASPEQLLQLSPERFELLVADRLAAMGLGVQRIGRTNRSDGGIDMVAWPERNASVPFLLAVQAKHSRLNRAVSSGVVRDLKGVLATAPFDVGLIVTNTRFSPDAQWVAQQGSRIVRLRDFGDLLRWLRSDFASEAWHRDLPPTISLGPGLKITLASATQMAASRPNRRMEPTRRESKRRAAHS
jgi:hypothetical protein